MAQIGYDLLDQRANVRIIFDDQDLNWGPPRIGVKCNACATMTLPAAGGAL
jgi:hypothetical protein